MDGSEKPSFLHLLLYILSFIYKSSELCLQILLLHPIFYLFLLLLFFPLLSIIYFLFFSNQIIKGKRRNKRKGEEVINKKKDGEEESEGKDKGKLEKKEKRIEKGNKNN